MENKETVKVNLPKSVQKDIGKLKMEEATKALKERISSIKKLEKDSGKPLSSEKLLGYMADIEKEFLATKIYNKLQSLLKEIEEKLETYDTPINTMKKQIIKLTKNHEDFSIMIKVSTRAIKIVGWVLGILVTIFTFVSLLSSFGR